MADEPGNPKVLQMCRLFCAWKGGGPCIAADCPRRPEPSSDSFSITDYLATVRYDPHLHRPIKYAPNGLPAVLLTALADILFDKQDVNHGRMTAGEMSLGEARDELFRQRKRDERE